MRSLIIIAAAALTVLFFASPPADAACNARGQFCGHASWASNAFAGKGGRVTNPDNLTSSSSSRRRSR